MKVIAHTTLGLLLVSGAASAQSASVLEAVRRQRPDALSLARAELAACTSAPSRGKCHKARLSLLVGYLQLTEGDAQAAAAQLASHEPPKGLASIHAYYLGQAQFYAHHPDEAAKSFKRALTDVPAWLEPRLRARLGEALLASGQLVEAAPLLEKAAPELGAPELYWQRAVARRSVGNVDGERADLKTLALRFPSHPYAAKALERLQAERTKRPLFTFEERLARARSLLESGLAREALDELDATLKQKLARGMSARAKLALVRAVAHFATGEAKEGERELDVALKGQPSIASEALMLRARRALRTDNGRARALMAEVARRFPKEPPADDAAYLAGWLALQSGKYAEAVKTFEGLEERHPRSRKRDEALWFRALALIRLERPADARGVLEELMTRFPRSSLVPQAKYWAARCQQLSSKEGREAAAAEYEAVIQQFPGSFYALLASERLNELDRAPPPAFPEKPRRVETKPPRELDLALELAAAGLFQDAAEEIEHVLDSLRGSERALAMGHALQGMGEYGHAHALAVRFLWGAAYTARNPEALALMYPKAFAAAVEREARAHALEPFLVWAIMRRESAFRPDVTSAADARGLMQIIPPTAAEIARSLKLEAPDPDALFTPELNIRFGTWYLAALQQRFGHPALCAAAYNAGPAAVLGWLEEKGELPLDLWIEEIPYKETRGYVKQVVADYFTYRSLYGSEPLQLSLTLPSPRAQGVSF